MLRTRLRAGPVSGLVLSLCLALALTLIHVSDRLVGSWRPALDRPTATAVRVPYGPRLVRNPATRRAEVRYERRRIVIPRGVVLDARDDSHNAAFEFAAQHRELRPARVGALLVIFFTLGMALTAYLRKFGQRRLRLFRVQAGILGSLALMVLTAKVLLVFTTLPEFWIPVAAVPLWIATSFDRRTAFVVAVVLAFAVASLLEFDLVLLSVMLSTGLGAALLLLDRKRARQMALSGAVSGLSAAGLLVAILVSLDGSFDIGADLALGVQSSLIACVGGGIFGGSLAALLHAPAERLLGHVSRERLLELSDLEQPLLQTLARDAPGTFEHSRTMANLAEQAASSIGADALLTRVGAYYHDVGKSAQAKYFVENLGSDDRSPHDGLDPEVSADAIMAHVVIGARMLRAGGIPEAVVEFAYTHHGTQIVEYFWNKCLEQGNPKGLKPANFRYPGMKPQTKETAILMLVDSIEAASRTVDPPEKDRFEQMVQRVVFTKLTQGQLDDCGLDLKDLRVIGQRVVDTLVNMHHHRIKYQWQTERAKEFGVPSRAFIEPPPEIEAHPLSRIPPTFASVLPADAVDPPESKEQKIGEARNPKTLAPPSQAPKA
jgi:cyclic-di-AMP phosphodiesterase PgpH